MVSVIDPTLGRNATGDTERMSKPAQIVLAAHVRTLERRRNQATIAADERPLNVEAQRIAPILHRNELLVLNDRTDRANRSSQPRKLQRPP